MFESKDIPNALTILRILLALAFPLVPESWHIALVVAALITEFFDGFLARFFHWASLSGQKLDPVADKLFFISVCATWVFTGKLQGIDLVLLGIRDIGIAVITAGLFLAGRWSRSKMVKPTAAGKLATVLQYITFFTVLWWGKPNLFFLYLTGVVGLAALIQYGVLILRQQRAA